MKDEMMTEKAAGIISFQRGEIESLRKQAASAEDFVKDMLLRCARAMSCMGMIDKLRADEGAAVVILCDNPDGPPNCAVEVIDEWTGFVAKRFAGDTLASALNAALRAKAMTSKPLGGTPMDASGGDPELKE